MTIQGLEQWGEHGLAGLVIIALFVMLFKIIGAAKAHFDVVMDSHRDERKEWRVSQESRDDKLERALNGLSDSLRK